MGKHVRAAGEESEEWPPFDPRAMLVVNRGAGTLTYRLEKRNTSWHPGSQSSAARAAMEQLLADERSAATRALCHTLLPDYACFGYALPPACRHIDVAKVRCPIQTGL